MSFPSICLALMIMFHDFGHYFWDILITKIPSKFIFGKIRGRWAFGVRPTFSEDRIKNIQENPEYWRRDRLYSRIAGIFGVIPAIEFAFIFPEYTLIFLMLELVFGGYSIYESYFSTNARNEHPWIIRAINQPPAHSIP